MHCSHNHLAPNSLRQSELLSNVLFLSLTFTFFETLTSPARFNEKVKVNKIIQLRSSKKWSSLSSGHYTNHTVRCIRMIWIKCRYIYCIVQQHWKMWAMSDLLDTGIQMSPMYLSQCGTITPFYVDPFSHDSHLSFSFKRTNPSNGKTSNMNFMTCPRSFSFLLLCYSEHGCWVGFSLILQKILTAIRPLCWKMLGGW